MGWSAAIYNLWKQGNNIHPGNHVCTQKKKKGLQIKWEVRTHIMAVGRFPITRENEILCPTWSILDKDLSP
jgi:hypothetical protein